MYGSLGRDTLRGGADHDLQNGLEHHDPLYSESGARWITVTPAEIGIWIVLKKAEID